MNGLNGASLHYGGTKSFPFVIMIKEQQTLQQQNTKYTFEPP